MSDSVIQIGVFVLLTGLVALATWWQVERMGGRSSDSHREYFLAGGNLTWPFIAGSITLTNLSTDQLVGMNGNQMFLLAWWELSAVFGLIFLAWVFVPIYYRNNCTTTTELLEKKYNSKHLRATVSSLFLIGNVLIYLPIMLYTGGLFLRTLFGIDVPLIALAAGLAFIGGLYAILGGLRAVAVQDTFAGVGVLGMSLLIVFLALKAIHFDFSGIPVERLTMIGGNDSPIPWHTLLTGMALIQIFYWSTNQSITQRAMAAPSIKEARKGVLAAAAIRLLIVPAIVVIPGVAAYALFGDVNDKAYGLVVAKLLPPWLSGTFAACMAAAVLTSFNSVLNSSVTLYVCDIHDKYFKSTPDVARMNMIISLAFMVISVALVPIYAGTVSIINLVQQLNGLLSMPILSAFAVGLLFRNVDARAVIIAVISGTIFYGFLTMGWGWAQTASSGTALAGLFAWKLPHYIHLMAVTFVFCVSLALAINRFALGKNASFSLWARTAPEAA